MPSSSDSPRYLCILRWKINEEINFGQQVQDADKVYLPVIPKPGDVIYTRDYDVVTVHSVHYEDALQTRELYPVINVESPDIDDDDNAGGDGNPGDGETDEE